MGPAVFRPLSAAPAHASRAPGRAVERCAMPAQSAGISRPACRLCSGRRRRYPVRPLSAPSSRREVPRAELSPESRRVRLQRVPLGHRVGSPPALGPRVILLSLGSASPPTAWGPASAGRLARALGAYRRPLMAGSDGGPGVPRVPCRASDVHSTSSLRHPAAVPRPRAGRASTDRL